MTNVGQREAKNRLAHLLCETLVRMKAIGLADDHSCELAMTQAEIADAMGVSTVHVNRTLQELRAEGLISLKGSALQALDWKALKRVGDFDATYLHFRDPSVVN
jgi:CRP-like cAMP-binding protein